MTRRSRHTISEDIPKALFRNRRDVQLGACPHAYRVTVHSLWKLCKTLKRLAAMCSVERRWSETFVEPNVCWAKRLLSKRHGWNRVIDAICSHLSSEILATAAASPLYECPQRKLVLMWMKASLLDRFWNLFLKEKLWIWPFHKVHVSIFQLCLLMLMLTLTKHIQQRPKQPLLPLSHQVRPARAAHHQKLKW